MSDGLRFSEEAGARAWLAGREIPLCLCLSQKQAGRLYSVRPATIGRSIEE